VGLLWLGAWILSRRIDLAREYAQLKVDHLEVCRNETFRGRVRAELRKIRAEEAAAQRAALKADGVKGVE